eukprot:6161365-Alexandrium_andersonii.AAC.1
MSNVCFVPTVAHEHCNCIDAVPECMLEPGCRRWRLAGFPNTHKRAVLGNSDGAPPWGHPEPTGRQFRWAKVE